jgi:hypothetical protein
MPTPLPGPSASAPESRGLAQFSPPRASVSGLLAAVLVATAALLLPLASWQWQRNAYSLAGRGTRLVVPTTVGPALYIGDVANGRARGHQTIDLQSIRPRIVADTADATVTFWICRSASRIGSAGPDLVNRLCTPLTALTAGRLDVGAATDEQLLVAISPRHAGVIRIDGFDIRYRDGLRSGHQHTGNDITATAR